MPPEYAPIGNYLSLPFYGDSCLLTPPKQLFNDSAIGGQARSDIVDYQILKIPSPYEFPNAKDIASLFPMPMCNGIILEEATIDSLQDVMHIGTLSASQIASCYLQRVYQTDSYIEYVFSAFLW